MVDLTDALAVRRPRVEPDISRFPLRIAGRIAAASLIAAAVAGGFTFVELQRAQVAALWAHSHDETDDLIRSVSRDGDLSGRILHTLVTAGGFDAARLYDRQGRLVAQHIEQHARVLGAGPATAPRLDLAHLADTRLDRIDSETYVTRLFFRIDPRPRDGLERIGAIEVVKVIHRDEVAPLQRRAAEFALGVALLCVIVGAAIYPFVHQLLRRSLDLLTAAEESYVTLIRSLGLAIALRDTTTSNHCYRATLVAVRLAEAVGLDRTQMRALIAGSLVHDVGKIAVDDAVLRKPGRLEPDEITVIRTHVAEGLKIVGDMDAVPGAADVVAFHHERWDGAGYPHGLSGGAIPLVARIFAIADVFDSLCAQRPYKPALPFETVMQILRDERGTHFDPKLLDIFEPLAGEVFDWVERNGALDLSAEVDACLRRYFGGSAALARPAATLWPPFQSARASHAAAPVLAE